MDDLQANVRKRDGHESTIRGVVDFAREVRIHLRNMQVIFGSVAETAGRETGSFRIRPWGLTQSMDIQFDDVVLASTVKQMGWERHRAIAVAQQSGIFTNAGKTNK
ncbi:MAG TPA: hypothetical protein VK550_15450 [Polyangiaceae bacterium]|jgi:hypothetical protein|nr:hypothetical protein [Polyangiaceae bacterium]